MQLYSEKIFDDLARREKGLSVHHLRDFCYSVFLRKVRVVRTLPIALISSPRKVNTTSKHASTTPTVRKSRADSCLREGSAGSPRQFKTPRFAEMALYSFLEALTQYSSVSPRARLFSQLLGHDDALYLGEDAAGFALLVMSIILDKSKDPNGAYSSAGMGMIPVRTGLRCTPADATSDTNVVGAAVADAQRTSASRRRRRTTTTTPCPR